MDEVATVGDVAAVPGGMIAVPVLFFALSMWAFFEYSPQHENQRSLKIFNRAVAGLCFVLLAIWYFSATAWMERLALDKYKALFGLGLGGVFGVVYLGVFFLIRNFWIFADQHKRMWKR